MVKVAPMEGIIYNIDKVNISKVIAPPYDVISTSEQDKLYNLSPYNIVKLILGKKYEADNDNENRYTRAAKDYQDWKKEDVLKSTDKPVLFYYIQEYTSPKGEFVSRKGFIGKNYLEEFESGNVLPHEYTMGAPKADRLQLMKACKTNFSQIFMVYSDPGQAVDKAFTLPETPFIDVKDDQGVRNIVYVIDDEQAIKKVQELMQDKTLLIADGHHRYETALAYRDYMREQNPNFKEDDAFNWVMCYYTNLDDENLKVYPTHRIITREVDKQNLITKIAECFDVVEINFDEAKREQKKEEFVNELENAAKDNIAFGACFKGENKYYLFKLRDKAKVDKILEDKDVPPVLRKLDLSLLHKIVVSDIIGFSDEDQMKQNGIKYIKKEEEAFEAVENNRAEVIFIMATPKIKDIKDVSQEGYRMPQKSTYFYPKLLSGLAINPLG